MEKKINYKGQLKDTSLCKVNWYDGTVKYFSTEDDFVFSLLSNEIKKLQYLINNNELEFLKPY
jgi:hypothetical protein